MSRRLFDRTTWTVDYRTKNCCSKQSASARVAWPEDSLRVIQILRNANLYVSVDVLLASEQHKQNEKVQKLFQTTKSNISCQINELIFVCEMKKLWSMILKFSRVYDGLRKQFKHIFSGFQFIWEGRGGEGRKTDFSIDSLLSFFCHFLYSFLVKSLALRNVNGKHTKKTPATQGSRLRDTFTDLHKFPCLVTSLLLGSLSSSGQYKQKRT